MISTQALVGLATTAARLLKKNWNTWALLVVFTLGPMIGVHSINKTLRSGFAEMRASDLALSSKFESGSVSEQKYRIEMEGQLQVISEKLQVLRETQKGNNLLLQQVRQLENRKLQAPKQ